MAVRNRPRGLPSKDDHFEAHEERTIWNDVLREMKKLKALNTRAADVSRQIVETEKSMASEKEHAPSVAEIDFLQALYREGLKLAEEEQRTLNEDQMSILKNLNILIPLRTHSENNPTIPTRPSKMNNGSRGVRNTNSLINSDSPAASPAVSTSTRPTMKDVKASRSGSVSSTVNAISKTEDGSEGTKPPVPERTGPLYVGAQVAYRPNKMKMAAEYEWIQCRVVAVNGEGKQRRYEVQDPEPDSVTGAPGQVYRTGASSLIPIPLPGTQLPDYPKGKQVLARYPETTTFYRAEVMSSKKDFCRLKFEGEDEEGKEMEVDRRFVLDNVYNK
ncbi:MAG: SAGA HAT/Core module component [Candelina mexicana]|nr:MAG: SAGA HAT/Core module component [Candelina mexicana]